MLIGAAGVRFGEEALALVLVGVGGDHGVVWVTMAVTGTRDDDSGRGTGVGHNGGW